MENSKTIQTLPNETEIKSYLDSQPYYGTCTTENIEGIEQGILWHKEKAEPIIATLQSELKKAKELLRGVLDVNIPSWKSVEEITTFLEAK